MQTSIKLLCVIEATTVTGPAKNLLNFARLVSSSEFQEAGLPRVQVSIATFHRARHAEANGRVPTNSPNAFVAAAREQGLKVHVINERYRFDPKVVEALRLVVARESPDIIQTHNLKSHFLIKLSGIGRQHPWIAFHHGYTTTDLKMRLYNQLDRWSLPSADHVITVCQAFADQLVRQGVRRERISVLHNSINTNGVSETRPEPNLLRERFGIRADELVVLTVGRLSREKAQADLITALPEISRQSDLNYRLVLVGDGPERQRIERDAGLQGVGDRVVFAGQVSDVRPFYALADMLVLPSHSEGSPNVLLEAMAARVPIVATAVGGVPELVEDHESALLVRPKDPSMLAGAIAKLLRDAKLRQKLAANAFATVRRDYSPETYARSLINIYGGLRKRRKETDGK